MQQLVSYLDAHSGAASAILTLGILGLTILYVWSNFLLVKENRLLRKAGSDPEVVAYLLPDQRTPQIINLVVANVGNGPARDVQITFEADRNDFAAHRVDIDIEQQRQLLTVLPQNERFVRFFGMGPNLISPEWLRPFRVTVQYKNLQGLPRSSTALLDVRQFEGMVTLGRPPEFEVADALKKIAENTDRWSGRARRLKVEVITTREVEESARRLHEQTTGSDSGAGTDTMEGASQP